MADGSKLLGWKMGGTATNDPEQFDPIFGYVLDRNMIQQETVIGGFPDGDAFLEAEIGFALKTNLPNGVATIDELKESIDYVVGAVEFAKSVALPPNDGSLEINHVLATGTGQEGTIIGDVKLSFDALDLTKESARCFLVGEEVAMGIGSNIFGGPLNALFKLANLLPKQGRQLRRGQFVITGSLYTNPVLDSTANVQVVFDNLGEISFESQK
ncbi:MAG: hypothetical protein JXQ90_18635 [Cyclobacteriaceae bacterium]